MKNLEVCSESYAFWQPTELVNTLLSASARAVVRHWMSSSQFLDTNNEPTLLAMASSADAGFVNLVAQVNADLAPAVIFNELLRKGIVEQHISGCLLLRRSAYVTGVPLEDGENSAVDDGGKDAVAPRRRSNDFL